MEGSFSHYVKKGFGESMGSAFWGLFGFVWFLLFFLKGLSIAQKNNIPNTKLFRQPQKSQHIGYILMAIGCIPFAFILPWILITALAGEF